jgi:hypothetical protein
MLKTLENDVTHYLIYDILKIIFDYTKDYYIKEWFYLNYLNKQKKIELNICNTKLLTLLPNLTNLTELSLCEDSFLEDKHIKTLINLIKLELPLNDNITITSLRQLTKLEVLKTYGKKLTNNSFKYLTKLKELELYTFSQKINYKLQALKDLRVFKMTKKFSYVFDHREIFNLKLLECFNLDVFEYHGLISRTSD